MFKGSTSTRITIAALAILAIAGWAFAVHGFSKDSTPTSSHAKADSLRAAADAFREERDEYKTELIGMYESFGKSNELRIRLRNLRTPSANNYVIARLANRLDTLYDNTDYRIPLETYDKRFEKLRLQYAAAILKYNPVTKEEASQGSVPSTYSTTTSDAMGPVKINGQNYVMDFESYDGLPAVTLNQP